MIGHHGGLLVISQADSHDRVADRHQLPQPRQPRITIAVAARDMPLPLLTDVFLDAEDPNPVTAPTRTEAAYRLAG